MTNGMHNEMSGKREAWDEGSSRLFLDAGRLFTPRRDELMQAFLDLIPAEREEPFVAAELGPGQGWLTEAILRAFPKAKVIALDGSEVMLDHMRHSLSEFGDRLELRHFRLEEQGWLSQLSGLRCILSSLVVHHLDGPGKRDLFAELYKRLVPGGALLIADVVAPTSEVGRRHMAQAWDEEVKRQSVEFVGDLRGFDAFLKEEWNLYNFPDDAVDKPSPLVDQLGWMRAAGFIGVDAFWVRAGHALFGGYKPLS